MPLETQSPLNVSLLKGREKSVLRKHPWIFAGAIDRVQGNPRPGDTVEVYSFEGRFLGRGAFSPASQIRIRMWSFDQTEVIDRDFFERKIQRALAGRGNLIENSVSTAYRLVNAESDGLPGLVVDRYNQYLVCQFLTAGSERWKATLIDLLDGVPGIDTLIERSDVDIRKKEGLPLIRGIVRGDKPDTCVEIIENGIHFCVDLLEGHKTGFYLDQRDNRRDLSRESLGKDVLNCFSYTGGFGMAALSGGAEHVTNVDTSVAALDLAALNARMNHFAPDRMSNVHGDVFKVLRDYRMEGRTFALVVLDPPKFADSVAQVEKACRGYKDINLLAFQLIRPGGLLYTFSCSGRIENELFQKVVADAALDAGRDVRIIRRLSQAEDHPVALSFPEGLYLKGLVCQVW